MQNEQPLNRHFLAPRQSSLSITESVVLNMAGSTRKKHRSGSCAGGARERKRRERQQTLCQRLRGPAMHFKTRSGSRPRIIGRRNVACFPFRGGEHAAIEFRATHSLSHSLSLSARRHATWSLDVSRSNFRARIKFQIDFRATLRRWTVSRTLYVRNRFEVKKRIAAGN